MSLQSTPNADTRLVLLSHPDWLKLLRHFELGEGFALLVLLAGDSSVARLCRTELDLWLLARARPRVFALPIEQPEDLENVPAALLALAPPDGPIWIDGSGARELYEQAWTQCAMKLNRIRNTIMAQFATPLILVGPPWIREIFRDTAPDFWSVRTLVSEISIPRASTPLPRLERREDEEPPASGIDPDFTLGQAAPLRGRSDQERQLSRLLDRAGQALMARGRYQEAEAVLREALDLDEAAVRWDSGSVDDLRDLSFSYTSLGDLMDKLDSDDEACRFYREALKIVEGLVRAHPSDNGYLHDLAALYDRIGDVIPDEADQFYRRALAIIERLVREEPGRADYLRDLAVSYEKMGGLMAGSEAPEEARQFYEKAIAIGERLVSHNPNYADYQRDLSGSYGRMGDLMDSLGAGDEAGQYYRKALKIVEKLVRDAPDRVDYLRYLIAFLSRVGTPEQLEEARQKLQQLTKVPQ
ncbi:MAG TPA: tetratricopeptide repeat protein [Bryobacteraceae bacterium]|nr:tetratricopeptide repeat protein [Bryobacteraceae bacterium]